LRANHGSGSGSVTRGKKRLRSGSDVHFDSDDTQPVAQTVGGSRAAPGHRQEQEQEQEPQPKPKPKPKPQPAHKPQGSDSSTHPAQSLNVEHKRSQRDHQGLQPGPSFDFRNNMPTAGLGSWGPVGATEDALGHPESPHTGSVKQGRDFPMEQGDAVGGHEDKRAFSADECMARGGESDWRQGQGLVRESSSRMEHHPNPETGLQEGRAEDAGRSSIFKEGRHGY
ncbi:unnamed protein product, partial [Discosporangium mesarthrocarpum]